MSCIIDTFTLARYLLMDCIFHMLNCGPGITNIIVYGYCEDAVLATFADPTPASTLIHIRGIISLVDLFELASICILDTYAFTDISNHRIQ